MTRTHFLRKCRLANPQRNIVKQSLFLQVSSVLEALRVSHWDWKINAGATYHLKTANRSMLHHEGAIRVRRRPAIIDDETMTTIETVVVAEMMNVMVDAATVKIAMDAIAIALDVVTVVMIATTVKRRTRSVAVISASAEECAAMMTRLTTIHPVMIVTAVMANARSERKTGSMNHPETLVQSCVK